MQATSGRRVGDVTVELAQVAQLANLPLDALRNELQRLASIKHIATRYTAPAYYYVLLRRAVCRDSGGGSDSNDADNNDDDVGWLVRNVDVLERAAVRKLDAAHALLAALAAGSCDSDRAHAFIDAYFVDEREQDASEMLSTVPASAISTTTVTSTTTTTATTTTSATTTTTATTTTKKLALRKALLRGDAIAFARQHGDTLGTRVRVLHTCSANFRFLFFCSLKCCCDLTSTIVERSRCCARLSRVVVARHSRGSMVVVAVLGSLCRRAVRCSGRNCAGGARIAQQQQQCTALNHTHN